MTRIDFYVLEDDAREARDRFACRLVEKAWRLKNTIYLHAGSHEEAQRLDELMWSWRDGSFLPHVLESRELDSRLAAATPIRVGSGEPAGFDAGLLVNLDRKVPLFFSRFERVAEIVGGGGAERDSARERFRFYRDRGYTLETHRIGEAGR